MRSVSCYARNSTYCGCCEHSPASVSWKLRKRRYRRREKSVERRRLKAMEATEAVTCEPKTNSVERSKAAIPTERISERLRSPKLRLVRLHLSARGFSA